VKGRAKTFALATGVACLLVAAAAAHAAQVRGIKAQHRDGQTFVTWKAPPGSGWEYRVYSSWLPIAKDEDLVAAELVTTLGDSTACDKRLSTLTGAPLGFVVASPGQPLDPGDGLLVTTATTAREAYYAVIGVRNGIADYPLVEPGRNAVDEPVMEGVGEPRPVFQRTLTLGYTPLEIYTLWTSPYSTPLFPAMANRHGLAYDCGVVRGGAAPDNALALRLHARGWNFLGCNGTGMPGEWVLTLDDYLPNQDRNTFWYGYHEDYDVSGNDNSPPTQGIVQDYTMRRMVYTLRWALRTFPVDPGRVYAVGTSMGGIGSVMLALRHPELIAGVFAIVPKFDFSFLSDPVPSHGFNYGNALRNELDRMWGTVATNLPTSEGLAVFEELNFGFLSTWRSNVSFPPIIAFNGRLDDVVGWAEKIPFYQAMERNRHGGYFFFDRRGHLDQGDNAWQPLEDARYLYRFRSDRSFPALSRCSANQNPGSGSPTDGDSVGTINGFVEWDPEIVDETGEWVVTLRLRDLAMRWGAMPAPDEITVDVTPRRLQWFPVVPRCVYAYSIRRAADGEAVSVGQAIADARGVLTIEGVPVNRDGTILRVTLAHSRRGPSLRGLEPTDELPAITFGRMPVRGSTDFTVRWPESGEGTVQLIGVNGRVERELYRGAVPAGEMMGHLAAEQLPPGVYFLQARQREWSASRRVVVLE
jgi:pimeloyl-ACP methyl ester carboxylesterase